MNDGPIISDHAMLRFLERAGELDIETIRLQLSRSLRRAKEAATNLGEGDYTIKAGGLIYIVVNHRVVTTYADSGAPVVARRRD